MDGIWDAWECEMNMNTNMDVKMNTKMNMECILILFEYYMGK